MSPVSVQCRSCSCRASILSRDPSHNHSRQAAWRVAAPHIPAPAPDTGSPPPPATSWQMGRQWDSPPPFPRPSSRVPGRWPLQRWCREAAAAIAGR
eukprot:scaffold10062_cov99-Isochrysis_galbana.AAC.5